MHRIRKRRLKQVLTWAFEARVRIRVELSPGHIQLNVPAKGQALKWQKSNEHDPKSWSKSSSMHASQNKAQLPIEDLQDHKKAS